MKMDDTMRKAPSYPHRQRGQNSDSSPALNLRRASTSVIEGITYTPMRPVLSRETDHMSRAEPASPPVTRRERERQKLRRVRSVEAAAFRVNYVTSKHIAQNLSTQLARRCLSSQLNRELEVVEEERGSLFFTLSALLACMRPSEYCPLLVELTRVSFDGTPLPGLAKGGYLALIINKAVRDQSAVFVLQANWERARDVKLLLVLPVWSAIRINLSGDGALEAVVACVRYEFHMPSVRSLWSAMSALNKARAKACKHNYYPQGPSHEWLTWYDQYMLDGTEVALSRKSADEQFRPGSPVQSSHTPHADAGPLSDVLEELPVRSVPHPPGGVSDGPPSEHQLVDVLRTVMARADLDNITCRDLRAELELYFKQDLSVYKSLIDEKMMMVLGQMESSSEIFDKFLFLGTEWNASNREELDAKQVGFVLNMAIEIDVFFPELYRYRHVQIWDEPGVDILPHLDGAVAFINEAQHAESRILVHCKMGVSRSATAVLAWCMRSKGWTLDEAYTYIKRRRSIVKPNSGFWRQLQAYEARCLAERDYHRL